MLPNLLTNLPNFYLAKILLWQIHHKSLLPPNCPAVQYYYYTYQSLHYSTFATYLSHLFLSLMQLCHTATNYIASTTTCEILRKYCTFHGQIKETRCTFFSNKENEVQMLQHVKLFKDRGWLHQLLYFPAWPRVWPVCIVLHGPTLFC